MGGASSGIRVRFIWDASRSAMEKGDAPNLSVMEPLLSTCTKTPPSTASYQPADTCYQRAPEEHIWPTVSRIPSVILQPLSFPETPKEDLSLFTDPNKDQPICCLICDQIFSSRDIDSSKSECTQNMMQSETVESKSDTVMVLNSDKKEEVGNGEEEERVKEKNKEGLNGKLNLQPKDEWLRHLLLGHKIVIHQVSEICSLKRYNINIQLIKI